MVSVILPAYNTEDYIEECIQSVVNQSYKDLEIIIINDGSTDRTGEICRKWERKDKRIKYIEKENEGQGIARNLGIQFATGDYIIFVDSDDYIDHDLIHTVYSYITKEKADICVYAHYMVGDIIHKNLLGFKITHGNNVKNHKELFGNMTPIMCDKMFSSHLLKGRNLVMHNQICEDLVFNAQLYIRAKRICTLDLPLYYYRYKREGNISTSYERYFEVEQSINELNRIFHRDGYFEEYWMQLYEISFVMLKDILFRIKKRTDLDVPVSIKNKYDSLWMAYKDCLDQWFSGYIAGKMQEQNYLLIGSYNLRIIIHVLLLDEDYLREDYGYTSIISLMSDAPDGPKAGISLKSCAFKNVYRKRCVEQDFDKSFCRKSDFQDRDYIVMDLLDEISDLIEVDTHTYLTESEFLQELSLQSLQDYPRISLTDPRRRALFEVYARKLAEKINASRLPVILIKNFLCERHSVYYDVFTEYVNSKHLKTLNRELEWCYQTLGSFLDNVTVIDTLEFKDLVFTHEDFPFGCIPVYYNKAYYQRMAIQIGKKLVEKKGDDKNV